MSLVHQDFIFCQKKSLANILLHNITHNCAMKCLPSVVNPIAIEALLCIAVSKEYLTSRQTTMCSKKHAHLFS